MADHDDDDMRPMKNTSYTKVEECAQVLELPAEEFVKGRMGGPTISTVTYWFNIKKKDGQKTKVGRLCLDYDPIAQKFVRDICPYRASGLGQMAQNYYSNFLVRELQENRPRKSKLTKPTQKERKVQELFKGFKCHIKEFGSKTWTPWRLLRLTQGMSSKIGGLKSLNVRKIKGVGKKFSVADPKFGMDIQIKHDPNAKGAAQYDIQRDDRTELTEAELNYCFQPLQIKAFAPMKLKEAEADWKQLKKQIVDEDSGTEDEDKPLKSKKDRDKKRSSKSRDSDSKSSKSSKKSGSKKKKSKQFATDWNM